MMMSNRELSGTAFGSLGGVLHGRPRYVTQQGSVNEVPHQRGHDGFCTADFRTEESRSSHRHDHSLGHSPEDRTPYDAAQERRAREIAEDEKRVDEREDHDPVHEMSHHADRPDATHHV